MNCAKKKIFFFCWCISLLTTFKETRECDQRAINSLPNKRQGTNLRSFRGSRASYHSRMSKNCVCVCEFCVSSPSVYPCTVLTVWPHLPVRLIRWVLSSRTCLKDVGACFQIFKYIEIRLHSWMEANIHISSFLLCAVVLSFSLSHTVLFQTLFSSFFFLTSCISLSLLHTGLELAIVTIVSSV